MKISRLVFCEIAHRKQNFLLALLAITLAVASCVAVVTLVELHQVRLAAQIDQHEVAMQDQVVAFEEKQAARVKALDNEIRKITKNLGFNIIILPKDQNLADFHASDFAEKTMPESLVQKLADSPDILTVNHLRPAIIRKTQWPEQNREVLLMGISGVVPFAHRSAKKPLSEPVPPGKLNIGRVLADELGLKSGDSVQLKGETFEVAKIYPLRGSKDDVTVWIDLPAAQKMLELPGQINMIQALECNCASIDRLGDIQREISKELGDEVQVIELSTTAIARAKARNKVKADGIASLVEIKSQGESTLQEVRADGIAAKQQTERLATIVLPLMILGAGLLVGLLAWMNVRERRGEIGILRAIGTSGRQIFSLFVAKAILLGVAGAALGYTAGFVFTVVSDEGAEAGASANLFDANLLIAVMLLAPLLAVVASWLPAATAAAQDPATVLQEE